MNKHHIADKITASRSDAALHQPLRIDRVILREIRLALKQPFVTSSGTVSDRRVLLAEVFDSDGATAWSECVAMESPGYMPETVDTAWLMLQKHVIPRVLGREFAGPHRVHAHLEEDVRGHRMSKACIEMAVWALAAVTGGESLSNLLGGTRDRIATGIAIGLQDSPEALASKAKEAVTEGYQKIKIKIAPGRDLAYVEAVCDAVGSQVQITVDANSAYTLDDTEHLQNFDRFGLSMIEQPLAWDDFVRHATLQAKLNTPICMDESITSVDRAEDMIQLGSGRIINLKPGRVGGFTQSLAIHDVCATHGIPVWCGGMLETGIGRAYNVALASLPNFTLPGDVSPSARYWERDIVSPEWTMDAKGIVTVPRHTPGLGIEIDQDYIESLTVRKDEFKN
jgi:o-succinylbenzoate synthase